MRGDSLIWSIKQSFRDYVAELDDGLEERSSQVEVDGDGCFVFPVTRSEGTLIQAEGSVRFAGHRGLLDVVIGDVWLEGRGAGGLISVAHPRAIRNPTYRRLVIAEFESWQAILPTLTFDGAQLLGSVYSPGTMIDEVRITFADEV